MKTIVALSTAPLNCAIHTIRVSGDDCYKIVQKITKEEMSTLLKDIGLNNNSTL